MRVLMAYYPVSEMASYGHKIDNVTGSGDSKGSNLNTPEIQDPPGYGKAFTGTPGSGNGTDANAQNSDFFINLASDLFDHPLGLMIYMRDAQNDAYGAFYLEDVYLQAHSFNINASSILVAEGVSAQYDRLLPININP
jgi:hypothetical protein